MNSIPFFLVYTVGFIRKLAHDLIESFKSTLDEVREADILIHVVDISHPGFEDQIIVVNQTLMELGAAEKPLLIVFNKIDAYTFIEKDELDLTPSTKQNLSLTEFKTSWMAKENTPCVFISATDKENIAELREVLMQMIQDIHTTRYPNAY